MKVHHFQDASQFYTRAKDYLLSYEAHHCLLLGINNTLINHPQRYDNQPYLATVEIERRIVAVAIRTPPRRLILSKIEDFGAVEAIAQDLYLDQEQLPGVSGLAAEAQAFAQVWQRITGQSYKMGHQLRIHQLDRVQPISPSTGYLRQANEGDRTLLLDWFTAFVREAFGATQGDEERTFNHLFNQNRIYVWQDQEPVSIACGRVATSNSSLIGPVYTPPEFRRKGYATSCVAALSQTLLDQGNQYCFLFTDLANPTSNHIYQQIGYQKVGDWQEYLFK